jgi:hypothetical protein
MSRGLRAPGLVVALALLACWCAFLWKALDADRAFSIYPDNEALLGPLLASMSASLRAGDWPFRSETLLGGLPLYNLMQLSPVYPFYLAMLPIFDDPVETMHSLHRLVLGHMLLFEINMYVFLRVAGTSRLAAVAGAALVAFSANSFGYAIWINITAPYAWLPLYLAGIVGMLEAPWRTRYAVIALVSIVLLTFASPAQPLIHAVLMTGVLILARALSGVRDGSLASTARASLRIAGIAVLALLLTAPVLLPALREFESMLRWIGNHAPVAGSAPIPFDAFYSDQMPLADLGGVLFRFTFPPVGDPYVGVVSATLALAGVVCRPASWLVRALAFVATYALASAYGNHSGLAYVNHAIPLLNKVREAGRLLVLFQFAVGALAAIGLDEIRRIVTQREGAAPLSRLMVIFVLMLALGGGVVGSQSGRVEGPVSGGAMLGVLAGLALLTLVSRYKPVRAAGAIVVIAWMTAALVLLALEVQDRVPRIADSQYLITDGVALDRALGRVAELDPTHEFRVVFGRGIEKQQAAALASYHGLRTLNAYINPAPRLLFEQLYHHGPRASGYDRALGAKYLVCRDCTDVSPGFHRLETVAGYEIQVADDALPHWYVVPQVNGQFRDVPDFRNISETTPLRDGILFIERGTTLPLPASPGGAPCVARELDRSTLHERIALHCPQGGMVVLNEFQEDLAWRARIDGARTRTWRVNGNQIGVLVPAGGHLVDLRYRPRNALIGWAIAGITLAVLVGVALLRWRRSRRP